LRPPEKFPRRQDDFRSLFYKKRKKAVKKREKRGEFPAESADSRQKLPFLRQKTVLRHLERQFFKNLKKMLASCFQFVV
jgi:hypothetical protein